MTTHSEHRFSVTVRTSEPAVLYCLRALADFSQKTGNTRIVWGGTRREDWERQHNQVSFHFSDPRYRQGFLMEANRLLPVGSWEKVGENDHDPAQRQS
jgi:hypothetical protein